MRELLQDTAFGFFVRTITRGRLLEWEDQYEPNALEKYLSTASTPAMRRERSRAEQKAADLETPSDSDQDLAKPEAQEDAHDEYELIDWLPNDSKVRLMRYRTRAL